MGHTIGELVVGLEGVDLGAGAGFAQPHSRNASLYRIERRQEDAVGGDGLLDEIARWTGTRAAAPRRTHRALARPALQRGGELPAEVAGVLGGIDAVAAVGRMAVGRIAGDEDAPWRWPRRQRPAQKPLLERDVELRGGAWTCRRKSKLRCPGGTGREENVLPRSTRPKISSSLRSRVQDAVNLPG